MRTLVEFDYKEEQEAFLISDRISKDLEHVTFIFHKVGEHICGEEGGMHQA